MIDWADFYGWDGQLLAEEYGVPATAFDMFVFLAVFVIIALLAHYGGKAIDKRWNRKRREGNTMKSATRRAILLIGAGLIILSAMFPYWQLTGWTVVGRKAVERQQNLTRQLIFDPPNKTMSTVQMEAISVRIDLPRMALEWVIIGVGVGVALVLTSPAQRTSTKQESMFEPEAQ